MPSTKVHQETWRSLLLIFSHHDQSQLIARIWTSICAIRVAPEQEIAVERGDTVHAAISAKNQLINMHAQFLPLCRPNSGM